MLDVVCWKNSPLSPLGGELYKDLGQTYHISLAGLRYVQHYIIINLREYVPIFILCNRGGGVCIPEL